MKGKLTMILTVVVPVVLCIVMAIPVHKNEMLLLNLYSSLDKTIEIMATLFGFVLTALSILLAFEGNEKTRQLRDSRHYKTILGTYLISAIYILIGLIAFTIFYAFKIINNISSFTYIFLTAISFVYLLLTHFYLVIMVITLFHKKKKYY